MRTLVFLDTETNGRHPERRPYEIGLIVWEPGKPEAEYQWFISADHCDLGAAEPDALPIGHFYDRHPDYAPPDALAYPDTLAWLPDGRLPGAPVGARAEVDVLRAVERLTRDAQVWCSNPAFDLPMLEARMRANGICPSWYYHVEDIKSLARGYLHGRGIPLPEKDSTAELARSCGVDPDAYPAHTALGDCRLMADLYCAVTIAPPAVAPAP